MLWISTASLCELRLQPWFNWHFVAMSLIGQEIRTRGDVGADWTVLWRGRGMGLSVNEAKENRSVKLVAEEWWEVTLVVTSCFQWRSIGETLIRSQRDRELAWEVAVTWRLEGVEKRQEWGLEKKTTHRNMQRSFRFIHPSSIKERRKKRDTDKRECRQEAFFTNIHYFTKYTCWPI